MCAESSAGRRAALQTRAYAPPEALFGGRAWRGRRSVAAAQRYDMWSAGVLGLA